MIQTPGFHSTMPLNEVANNKSPLITLLRRIIVRNVISFAILEMDNFLESLDETVLQIQSSARGKFSFVEAKCIGDS